MPRVVLTSLLLQTIILSNVQGMDAAEPFVIQKTSQEIIFDGRLNEPAWNSLSPLPVLMYQPNYNSQPSEKTEIYVTYDKEYLYLAGRLYYENGAKISATSKKRDVLPVDRSNDYLGILLDSFNDNENAFGFQTTPTGLRTDFSVFNDALAQLENFPFNESWNTFWDVKTVTSGNLWEVEIRIPFSSLRFQDKGGKVVMGMTVWRYISDKQERIIYPLMSNEVGMFSYWRPSQAQKVIFEGITRKNPLYITPYVLGGVEQTNPLNETKTAYQQNNELVKNAGLDVKYALTSNLTMDLTVNTDFAQVESDDQMINLTRFDLFFPEKRQFFMERSSIFDFQTGFFDQMFYSRRIGLFEGNIVPIYGGARITGRAGKWDIGMMDMQTAPIDYIDEDTDSLMRLESTNHGVARLRRQVFNPRSYVGGMVTSKVDVNGRYNVNTGLDGIFNVKGNDYLTLNYSRTFETGQPEGNPFDRDKIYFAWSNRSDVGLGYEFNFNRAGKGYNPEMGFEMFEDYSSAFAELRYGWVNNDENKNILKHMIGCWSWIQKRNEGFATDLAFISPNWSFSTKNGFNGMFMLMNRYENPADTFEISDNMYFPSGKYQFSVLDGMLSTPANKLFSLQAMWSVGSYYDGAILTLGPCKLTARPSSSLQAGIDYTYNIIDVPKRNLHYTSHLARLKTELTFNTKLSLLMFFQYSSDEKFGINNIRLRYNPKEGNDLYLVFNHSYNSDLQREIPYLPFNDEMSVLLKYTYTFILTKKQEKPHANITPRFVH